MTNFLGSINKNLKTYFYSRLSNEKNEHGTVANKQLQYTYYPHIISRSKENRTMKFFLNYHTHNVVEKLFLESFS